MDARTILAALLFTTACNVGPDYKRPELPLPAGWRDVDAAEQQTLANTPWWELF
jgi:outer membrane protein TolC